MSKMSTYVLYSTKFNALVHNTVYSYCNIASSPEALSVAQGTRLIIVTHYSVTKDHWINYFYPQGDNSDNKTIQSPLDESATHFYQGRWSVFSKRLYRPIQTIIIHYGT